MLIVRFFKIPVGLNRNSTASILIFYPIFFKLPAEVIFFNKLVFLHIDDNEVFMRYCRFRGDIVVFLVYLVWDIVADFKIVGVKKNGICMC